MNNIKITPNQRDEIMHVVGESPPSCFGQLWQDLEWDFEDYMGSLPLMKGLAQRYLDFDATFDKETMILIIGEKQLEALNDMLDFAEYNSIEEPEYDLDITVK